MSLVDIDVKGIKELTQALKSLSGDMKLKGGEFATRAGAAVIHKAAKTGVPVKTGTLKRTLKIVKMSKKGDGTVRFYVTHVKKGRDDPWYAHIVEFGGIKGAYRIRPKRKKVLASGGTIYGKDMMRRPAKAQPYMRKAFENNTQTAVDAMAKRLDKYIERFVSGLFLPTR
jgi:HK97 gp10 family phage protein